MKKLSKTLCFCLALLSVAAFAACRSSGTTHDVTTPVSGDTGTSGISGISESSGTSTPAGSHTNDQSSATAAIIHGPPVGNAAVYNQALGLSAYEVVSDNPAVAEALATTAGVRVIGYLDGAAHIAVTDCYGHTASIDVSVSGNTVTATPTPTADRFIEARTHFGAKGDGVTDDTAAIQAALNSAKPGETVYVYPGIYIVDHLCMPEGVTLELFTTMTDATQGFTDELARQTRNGELTVLRGVRIMNNYYHQPGAEGSSHFTVRGGVLDMQETTKGAVIFACADGALLENVIFKDMKNNHAIQYTGCKNSAIRNCMFAGYTWGGTFTREVVQIEVSTPGATGTAATAPLTFEEGEFNYSENIEISHCYFGKSDRCGVPLMAIGHHSQAGAATVTGFRIKDNVFDGMLYAGIRYNGIVDTEISGNTFNAYAEYSNVNDASATTPAFIVLYSSSASTSYTSITGGRRVLHADVTEQAGIHGMNITGNTFNIPEGSDKKVIHVTGTTYTPGMIYKSGLIRQDAYNTQTYTYSGYTAVSNYIEGVRFCDNVINVTGSPAYSGQFIYFQSVLGLEVSGNRLNLADGVSFSHSTDGVPGLVTRGCTYGSGPDKYVITTAADRNIALTAADGKVEVQLIPRAAFNITLAVEGQGRLTFNIQKSGRATVTPVAAEGYVADGWYTVDGRAVGGAETLTGATTMIFRFKPVN